MAKTITDKTGDVLTLEFCLGQLRHAYVQLLVGAPLCPPNYWSSDRRKEFAHGLLGPVIQRLERMKERLDQQADTLP